MKVIDESDIAFPSTTATACSSRQATWSRNHRWACCSSISSNRIPTASQRAASIDQHDPLIEQYTGATMIVRVTTEAVFANCRRYVHHYELVERSLFVPGEDHEPPVPDWKRDAWFAGTLPNDDPAHDPDRPDAPAIPRF